MSALPYLSRPDPRVCPHGGAGACTGGELGLGPQGPWGAMVGVEGGGAGEEDRGRVERER